MFPKRSEGQRRNLNQVLTSQWRRWWRDGVRCHWKLPSACGGCSWGGRGGEKGKVSMGVGQEGWGHLLCLKEGMGRAGCGAPRTSATRGWRRKVAPADCLKTSTLPALQHPPKRMLASLLPTRLWIEKGNIALPTYITNAYCLCFKAYMPEKIFLKEAHRVGPMR